MRDEFSKHRGPGQECRRLLETAENTASRSFLCLLFVVSQSVMLVERLFFRGAECVLCEEDVWLCICVRVRVGLDKKYARVARQLCWAVFQRCEWLRALSVGVLL